MSGCGFGWVLLAMALYGGLHSALASHTAKRLAERWLGSPTRVRRYYRLTFSLLAVLTLLPVFALVLWLPDTPLYRIPWPWTVLTLAGQALGGFIILIALRRTGIMDFLGLTQAINLPQARVARLQTEGIYRLMRHPLYTGSLLVIWLMPLMTCNLLAFNLGTTAYFILGAYLEESKLRTEFGPTYEDYARRTPMFIPRLSTLLGDLCRCSGLRWPS